MLVKKMIYKEFIRDLLPPVLGRVLRRLNATGRDRLRFTGDYYDWDSAVRDSGGYAAPEILEITRRAMIKIKQGEALFERDSVLFAMREPPFPLISGLLREASLGGNRLSVLDFGGALGSSYFQCRPYLDGLTELSWSVVEQPGHVACGKAEFTDKHLRFYDSFSSCVMNERPSALLLSSVLQYLPDPYAFLTDALRHPFRHVLVDRTAFHEYDRDRLTVQHVPKSIYPASYPAWFLSRSRFLAQFAQNYKLVDEFSVDEKAAPEGGGAFFKGYIFERHSVEQPRAIAG
jgi:putative methyltransferase (TIGR04325 family)